MKKVILSIAVMVLAFNLSNAQTIERYTDEMTDEKYWLGNEAPIFSENGGDGFSLRPLFNQRASTAIMNGIALKIIGLSCVEKVSMYILFDNGEKLKLTAWNKFNCDGAAYFTLKSSQKELLLSSTINKVKVQNGRNYESFTFEAKEEDKNYFIRLKKDLDEKNYLITSE